ncbi:MAG: SWIM zinc finger family protein [Fimbriimonadales bacterium]|nr:SWIM zinc finger family protein [Fimbriimonadales bacterium]
MMTARTIEALYRRLERARELVSQNAVYPVAGMDELYVVRNGDGNAFYLVSPHSSCTCPDFEKHDGKLPCKHLLAVELYQQQAQAQTRPARRTRPTQPTQPAPSDTAPQADIPMDPLSEPLFA